MSGGFIKHLSGWWLGHPSEKYEFVNWDEIPNINGKINNGNQTTNQLSTTNNHNHYQDESRMGNDPGIIPMIGIQADDMNSPSAIWVGCLNSVESLWKESPLQANHRATHPCPLFTAIKTWHQSMVNQLDGQKLILTSLGWYQWEKIMDYL